MEGKIIFSDIDIEPLRRLSELLVDDLYIDSEGHIQLYSEVERRNY